MKILNNLKQSKILFLILFNFLFQFAFAQKQLTTHQLLLAGHSNDVNSVAISLKFNLLASAGWDNTINIYSGDTTFKLIKTISDAHRAPINTIRFNKQGNLLASASNDFVINVFDSTFKKTKMLVAHDGHVSNINAITFDNSGKVIFSGDDAGRIIIWSIETQKKLRELSNGVQINALAMSNDPRTIFVAGQEPIIKVINVANGQIQRSFVGHTDAINAMEISPNQQYLLSGSNDKSARIWETKTGKELFKLPVDCWKVTSVAFSFDSKYCATGCNDGSIKIWEVETGKLIESITSQKYNTRDLVFMKRYCQIAAAPMLKGSEEYGVRIYPTDLTDPITQLQVKVSNSTNRKFQNPIDSVNSQLKSIKSNKKIKSEIVPKLDSVRIFKTPSTR